jgi:hypothetical protein
VFGALSFGVAFVTLFVISVLGGVFLDGFRHFPRGRKVCRF